MVSINFANKEIRCRLVVAGPADAGRATTLRWLSTHAPSTSIEDEGPPLLSASYSTGTQTAGLELHVDLVTPRDGTAWVEALSNADGVLFVADSDPARQEANAEAWDELETNLREVGLDPGTIPLVFLWNKRDVDDAVGVGALAAALNPRGAPAFECVALRGTGLSKALDALLAELRGKLGKEYGLDAGRAGAGGGGGAAARRSRAAPKRSPAREPSAEPEPEAEGGAYFDALGHDDDVAGDAGDDDMGERTLMFEEASFEEADERPTGAFELGDAKAEAAFEDDYGDYGADETMAPEPMAAEPMAPPPPMSAPPAAGAMPAAAKPAAPASAPPMGSAPMAMGAAAMASSLAPSRAVAPEEGRASMSRDYADLDDAPRTVSQQGAESIMRRISEKKILPPEDAPAKATAAGTRGASKKRGKLAEHSAPSTAIVETFERSATVRYFRQMYPMENYPLSVILSKKKIREVVIQRVAQATSQARLTIRADNPILHIRLIIPGCMIQPAEQDLDVTPHIAEARFWITPMVLGNIEDAHVELTYEGRVIDVIPIPLKITKQTLAKLSAVGGVASPALKPVMSSSYGAGLQAKATGYYAPKVLAFLLSTNGAYTVVGALAFITLVLYWWKRPKSAEPIESFFDFEVEDEKKGSWFIKNFKAKLMVFHPHARWVQVIDHRTPLGSSPESALRLARPGVEPHHAVISYSEQDGFLLQPSGTTKVDDDRVDRTTQLGREAVLTLGSAGEEVWFYDERPDKNLDRRRLRKKLIKTFRELRPEAEQRVRDAFGSGAMVPTRRVVANLILAGVITLDHWKRARARHGI
jgi:signal recognition particle receptor subunit beta